MSTPQQTLLQLALEYNVLRFGTFTLKSGRESPYFRVNVPKRRTLYSRPSCSSVCIMMWTLYAPACVLFLVYFFRKVNHYLI